MFLFLGIEMLQQGVTKWPRDPHSRERDNRCEKLNIFLHFTLFIFLRMEMQPFIPPVIL